MKFRILYIEDEKILGQLVCEALQKQGYDVLQIANGAAGLQAYRNYKPHLCLLDVMLPGKDGYEIATQIRAIDKKIPILFLTAKVQVTDLVAGFNAGCNDYIRKPFSVDELNLRINNWLTEKYGQPETHTSIPYQIDSYIFNPQLQTLQTSEKTIQLTHKESLILQLLYNHKNNIITREYLTQKVWGNETGYNSRTLDVYITRLRKYFGNETNRIITLKGIGFRFICDE